MLVTLLPLHLGHDPTWVNLVFVEIVSEAIYRDFKATCASSKPGHLRIPQEGGRFLHVLGRIWYC